MLGVTTLVIAIVCLNICSPQQSVCMYVCMYVWGGVGVEGVGVWCCAHVYVCVQLTIAGYDIYFCRMPVQPQNKDESVTGKARGYESALQKAKGKVTLNSILHSGLKN